MLLSLRSISKRFPGVQALDKISVDLDAGEVVAVVGENGAGKSTLLKILAGIHSPDEGQIVIEGNGRERLTVRESMTLGIQLIHQELNLADNLNIAENIFLGAQPYRVASWLPVTDRPEMHRRATALLERVGLGVSSKTRVGRLSLGQRQLVEVAKALSRDARILVFDEPTSSLSPADADRLLSLINDLRGQGVAVLYVSHRLNEIVRIAARVMVLRDGKHVGTLVDEQISEPRMISMMVGRELSQIFPETPQASKSMALEVRGLTFAQSSTPISFSIAKGEIVGFAGLVGAGRTELARAIFGADLKSGGEIWLDGERVLIDSPYAAVTAGMALIPEDRKREGLILEMPVGDNLTMVILGRLSHRGIRRFSAERSAAADSARRIGVRTPTLARPVQILSGGNQQKTVLAKWLASNPRLLILDEPTRGVDVGAKQEIYELIVQLAASGVGIMLISSEMEEIVGLSHRVIVMHDGAIQGELVGDAIDDEQIIRLAVGKGTAQKS